MNVKKKRRGQILSKGQKALAGVIKRFLASRFCKKGGNKECKIATNQPRNN
jgi:hypothetical protein